jgi:hypothetical protein
VYTGSQAAATALACPSLARGSLLSARVKYYSCTYTRRYSSREQRSSSIFLRCPPELSMSITTWPPRAFRARAPRTPRARRRGLWTGLLCYVCIVLLAGGALPDISRP